MRYECSVCGHVYDESAEGVPFADLPDDWECPVCGAEKVFFEAVGGAGQGDTAPAASSTPSGEDRAADDLSAYLGEWRRTSSDVERDLALIHAMATSGESVLEPMRTSKPVVSWDEILVLGAQLARLPRNQDEPASTRTVIGPGARRPLEISMPAYVSHMSFGALSREAKLALATGSAMAETAMCSGEGGVLPESLAAAHRYIFEYVPNRYSVTDETLAAVDAVEIKIGQSVKPGMGGHLPGGKVTAEIAAVRGFPEGEDIVSPARFADIADADQLRETVGRLREATGGAPIGVKLAAGRLEADLEVALAAGPDFITIDGRAGATGAAPKVVKDATSVPTIYALARARRFLDERGAEEVSLVVTGGFRLASDVVKALAMGADAVALATAALVACGCQQYRICHTGRCPVGVTTQDPELRARLDVDLSARRLANYLAVLKAELQDFTRLTGREDVHHIDTGDLCTTSSEIAAHTPIVHAGAPGARN